NRSNDTRIVADKEDCSALLSNNVLYLAEALFLKLSIANSKHFIDQHDFRLQMSGYRKREPHVHAGGIVFNRCIEKFFDLCECNDLIEFFAYLSQRHTEYRSIQENILAPRQFRVKSCTYFK